MSRNLVSALAFVDFDNYANLPAYGVTPNATHVEMALDKLVVDLWKCCREELPSTNEIEARLYGGWYDREKGGKSQRLGMLEKAIAQLPGSYKGIRLLFRPVNSLLASQLLPIRLEIRKEPLRLKITADMLARCACPDQCMTKLVADWQKHGCSHCAVPKEEILQRITQKAVDTAIVADLVYAVGLERSKLLVLVSNDYDILPGALYAEAGAIPFRIICTNERCALSLEVKESTLYITDGLSSKNQRTRS